MIEGDEWKELQKGNDRNHPNNVALDEYKSIISTLYEVLRPGAQGGEQISKSQVTVLKSDLEKAIATVEDDDKVDIGTKNAYWNLNTYINTLDEINEDYSTDEENNMLKATFSLLISCSSFSDSMKLIYVGRNPCRQGQVELQASIIDAKESVSNRELIKGAERIVNTCDSCPYK